MCSVTIRFNVRTLFTFFSFSNVQNANFEEIKRSFEEYSKFHSIRKKKKKGNTNFVSFALRKLSGFHR